MAGIALNNATIATSTIANHIDYDYDVPDDTGGYTVSHGRTSADINGTCNATANAVYVNGVNVILEGDTTIESDSYTISDPNPYNITGSHSGASGSVSSGNLSNVYIGGKLVAVSGSTVTTHASTSTTINGGGSANVFIGG